MTEKTIVLPSLSRLRTAKKIIATLAHPIRRQIVEKLSQGEMNVTELYTHFKID